MADNIFGTAYPNEYANSINVTQYGWSEFDEAGVVLIQDYIKQAQTLRDACQKVYEEIQLSLQNIPYIKDAYTYISTAYEDFKIKYPDFDQKYKNFLVQYNGILLLVDKIQDSANKVAVDKQLVISMRDEVVSLKSQIEGIQTSISNVLAQVNTARDDTLSYKDAAAASAKEAKDAAEELKKGQVYRGLWNPQVSGSYPAKPTTNSYWDVTLNEGTTSFTFDNKNWKSGQRLIYTLLTTTFDQGPGLQVGVTSFNGREGAITPQVGDYTAAMVGADPAGTASTTVSNAISLLKGDPDPFPIYTKDVDIPNLIPVKSVNGRTGNIVVEEKWEVVTNRDPISSSKVLFLADTSAGMVSKQIPLTVEQLFVKDTSGKASTNKITITCESGLTVNGQASEDIDKDFGYVQYFKINSNLITIGGL